VAFSDRLAEAPPRPGAPQVIAAHLKAMDPTEAKDAETLLRSRDSDDVVARAFCAEGFQASNTAVRTWRIINRAQRFAT